MSKLKCCPFCGGDANTRQEDRGQDNLDEVWVISCSECPCEMVGDRNSIPTTTFPDELKLTIDAWNNR